MWAIILQANWQDVPHLWAVGYPTKAKAEWHRKQISKGNKGRTKFYKLIKTIGIAEFGDTATCGELSPFKAGKL